MKHFLALTTAAVFAGNAAQASVILETEPNDDVATADLLVLTPSDPLNSWGMAVGELDVVSGGDYDWYTLTVAAGTMITASITPTPVTAIAGQLSLFDSASTLIDQANGWPGFLPVFSTAPLAAGDYYLVVSGLGGFDASGTKFDHREDGKYMLSVNTMVPEPASLALLGLGGLAIAGRRRRN